MPLHAKGGTVLKMQVHRTCTQRATPEPERSLPLARNSDVAINSAESESSPDYQRPNPSMSHAHQGHYESLPTAYSHMPPTPTSLARRSQRATLRRQQSPPMRSADPSKPNQKLGKVHVATLKERAQAFIDGPFGIALETLNVVLSVVLVAISVAQSYEHEEVNATAGYNWFELSCTAIFAFDYLLHLYAADKPLKFAMSPMAIIDLLTILPTILTLFLQSLNVSFLPILRTMRVFRMLAVLRLYRIVQSYSGFDYELGVLAFTIFTLIFVAAGVIQILDEDYYKAQGQDPLQFHQCVYFVFVTMSTVGYGDISPRTTASQMFVIVMICVVVIVIPRQVQRINELSRLQHGYMHSYSVRKSGSGSGGHVIVTGSISFESVSSFLSEFYRPGQGKVNMDVVVLSDQIPSERLLTVLRNVKYRRRVTYLKGSLLNDKDARRVHVESAGAVFILADKKNVKHAEAADALTILQALAVDKFKFRNEATMAKRRNGGTIRCFLQVLSPQRTRGLRTITGAEVALNTPRLRTAILAKSIICPGATALVLNLVCSIKEEEVSKALFSNVPWIAEYAYGLQHQLYPVILPPNFKTMTYESAVLKLYHKFHIILIAVFVDQVDSKCIRICPFGHELRANDLAFVIALSASEAQHAVESLSIVDVTDSYQWMPPPTLVFAADTVLGRKSFERERAPSIHLPTDDELTHTDANATAFQEDDLADECEVSPDEFESRSPPVSRPAVLTPHSLRKLQDHIIICGPFAHGHQLALYLDDLYRNECRRETRPHILLLVKRLPTELDLQDVSSSLPENVFVEKGVSQNVEDLLRVRAFAARAVLMIPGNWKYHVDELRDETADEVSEHLLDYQVIMSTLSMRTVQDLHQQHLMSKAATPDLPLTTPTTTCSVVKWHESIAYFAHKSDIADLCDGGGEEQRPMGRTASMKMIVGSFLRRTSSRATNNTRAMLLMENRDTQRRLFTMNGTTVTQQQLQADFPKGPPPLFAPSYAAGEVFVDGVLDTLLCQSFFNPYVIDLVRAIAGDYYYASDHHSHATSQNLGFSMREYFEPSPRSATSPSKRTATLPHTTKDNKDYNNSRDLQHPVLATAIIARELEGQSFAAIFAKALQQEILVVAIRRSPHPHRGNALPYVFTCPRSTSQENVVVEKGDTLHVLTKRAQPICIR